jgi:hypothetical protein
VRNRIVQSVLLAASLCIASALPAAAQIDAASVGAAFLNNNAGVGVNADYSRALQSKAGAGFVADVAFAHKGFSETGVDFSVNSLMVSGGVRLAGKAGEKADWHVQGTVGVMHASGSFSGVVQSVCDLAGVDCSGSSNSFMIMPGGALTYWFSPKGGLKGQLNIPITTSGGASSGIRFDVNYVMKFGK